MTEPVIGHPASAIPHQHWVERCSRHDRIVKTCGHFELGREKAIVVMTDRCSLGCGTEEVLYELCKPHGQPYCSICAVDKVPETLDEAQICHHRMFAMDQAVKLLRGAGFDPDQHMGTLETVANRIEEWLKRDLGPT